MKVMNENKLKTLLTLAAALVLSGCGAAAEKGSGDSAVTASSTNTPRPAPPADGGANAATANAPAAAPAPSAAAEAAQQGASKSGASRSPSNGPPATMPTPRIGSGGNDFFLFTQARAAINADPELKAANLTLDVKEGVVTLSGTVASAAQRAKAEQLVREAGSQTVRNQLRVSAGN